MARRMRGRPRWAWQARRLRETLVPLLSQAFDWRIAAAAVLAFVFGLGLGLTLAPSGPAPERVATLTPVPPPPSPRAPRPAPPRVEAPMPAPESIAPAAGPPAAAAPPARSAAPVPAPHGELAPWRRYAVAAPARAGRAAVAIVLDDLGLDRRRTARAIGLPGPLTLSFLPYATELAQQAEAGHRAGHELLLHLPMEAESRRISPGPNALRTGLEPTELLDLLAWNLGRFNGYVGVNNHMGSRFTADAGGMRTVLAELERRGLMFLDSRTSSHSVGYRLGAELGLPVAQRDVFLDNVLTADRVNDQLAEVERIAKRHGHAIAIGHPHDATLDALAEWLPQLEARGLALVPITALVRPPAHAQARG
jgi:polysaccharide deacetylase 2 family uncharacterized protein YibQ